MALSDVGLSRDTSIHAATHTHGETHGYTVDVPLSPYIMPYDRSMLFSVSRSARDERIRRGALARRISHVGTGKSKIPYLRYTSRSRMVTNAGESAVLLPHVPRTRVQHARLHISPGHIHCPPCVFPGGVALAYLGGAQFSLYDEPTTDSDHAVLRETVLHR